MLHIHVLLTPLGACHMAESGTDQHQGGVLVGECHHHAGPAAYLAIQPLDHIVGMDTRPVENQFMLGDTYITYKIPVKSYAIMLRNDRHSPNRDFVFSILFDDTGNWQCRYMGYAWYVFS